MSTPQFRAGNPLAPEKGAFPLDHFGECATFKETYLKCLQKQKSDANKCKMESKSYLECRMAKELMAKQPLHELGFKEEQKSETNETTRGRKEEENKRSTPKEEEEENERNGFVAGARRARQQQKEFAEAARRRRREGRY
ncbi:cytochrome c oxidase assembly protein COX19 [Bathycoccus prasinos]|uniref:Cytochrome c oxidase assembly protein COX19 n=1 Tax=Bathycoccus prasinos TaxID=41875 RepID=K8EKE9_9CHLO|nr:cytochrome c oxidase assembly protein COX19 [Bathycoccus prasinos]CCO18722.1 cytochrome c oxidase assembly protein COX19 [Bathycoccus prasinos]|eukprot:XP_007510377.1 cytochrome c oxidase assembly protein COX19 [Bathycoccus prasinos]